MLMSFLFLQCYYQPYHLHSSHLYLELLYLQWLKVLVLYFLFLRNTAFFVWCRHTRKAFIITSCFRYFYFHVFWILFSRFVIILTGSYLWYFFTVLFICPFCFSLCTWSWFIRPRFRSFFPFFSLFFMLQLNQTLIYFLNFLFSAIFFLLTFIFCWIHHCGTRIHDAFFLMVMSVLI